MNNLHNETDELNQPEFNDNDDLLNYLNGITITEDISDLPDYDASTLLNNEKSEKDREQSSDLEKVFADTLKVVSALEDMDSDSAALMEQISEEQPGKKKKNEKIKKRSKEAKQVRVAKDKSNQGLLARLFGKPKSGEAANQDDQEEISNAKKAKSKTKTTNKAKNKPKNKVKVLDAEEYPDEDEKSSKAAVKASKKKEKKPKKEKKAKVHRNKEVVPDMDTIEEGDGRISLAGTGIIVLLLGVMSVLLFAGTDVFYYNTSIQSAKKYFHRHDYTSAFNEICALKIKDQDIETYDKIRTVMTVNRKLDAYVNYFAMGKYKEALDSLLNGLHEYDRYIDMATILGIDSDLNYVREQMESHLRKEFGLSLKEASQISKLSSREEYNGKLNLLVSAKISNNK